MGMSRPMPWKRDGGERIDALAWRAVEHGETRGGEEKEGREGGGRGAGTTERATGEEDKRERGIGEEPGHGLDENSNMNEGATRKRDGNARREAERDEASRKREKRGRRWPEGRQRRRSERVKRVRRRNGWKANRGDQEGGRGYQERTSQVAVRWRIIIVASSVSRISFLRALRYYKRGHVNRVYARIRVEKLPTEQSIENSYLRRRLETFRCNLPPIPSFWTFYAPAAGLP